MANSNTTAQQPAPTDQLDAPISLSADQLEHVVGGLAIRLGPLGPIGPINGLIRVLPMTGTAVFQ